MDITLTDEQCLLQETASGFARDAFDASRARSLETAETSYDADLWKRMADLGLAGAPLPARHGGSEVGLLELGLVVEALGANALATPLFASVVEAGLLLADCASEEQQARWLPAICRGEAVLTVAYLETGRQYRPLDVETRLSDRAGDRFLSGRKLFVREAGAADAIVCLARTDAGEMVLAIVDPHAEGVRRERMQAAGGESLWAVHFDDARIDAGALVHGNGIAAAIERLSQRGAALKSCELVGIGQAALDLTVAYASSRTQFGVPIGSFQAVQHHCAEMYRDIAITRLLARQACSRLDGGEDAQREVSFAKAKSSEAMPRATRTAHQVHGAIAYYRDYPLELHYHRAMAAQAAYGNGLHHKSVLNEILAGDLDRFRGDTRHEL